MTICSAACQIACAIKAKGKKLLWMCLPPGQKMSRKLLKAQLLMMVMKIGWERTTTKGDWGVS